MRGKRCKALRHEFERTHGRSPGRTEWDELGRDKFIPAIRTDSVVSRFVGRFTFFRALWAPAKKADRSTKLHWFSGNTNAAVLQSRSEWRSIKRAWKRGAKRS